MNRRLGLLVMAVGLVAAAPPEFAGPARVVDGDTFTVGAERVRLWGVDAPEGRQICLDAKGQGYACGDVARDQLARLIGGRTVRCEIRDRDPYGRAVSRCQAGSTDLGGAMVRAGWAVDYAQFSRGAYASTEAEARRARRGLWAGNVYNGRTYKPVAHEVVWDAELSAASAVVLASILEWPTLSPVEAGAATMRAAAAYCRLKDAIKNSQSARAAAAGFAGAAQAASAGKALRNKYGKEIAAAALIGVELRGDPVADWRAARAVLAGIPVLADVLKQVRLVRLFRATDALGQGLADMWVGTGAYKGAAVFVKKTLDQERLISAELEPQGCLVMNIHKSKGKEFDGVVLVEGQFKSHFFDEKGDPPPSPHARRLLRVAITRARTRVAIIRSQGAAPPLVTA